MAPARVTVIIVAHSVRSELERCLASIDEHAAMPVQTILVDNASDDDTREWVREHHREVTVIELEENIGVAARDRGLGVAETPHVMFLDSDAALTPGALPALVTALEQHPSWGLVGPKLVYDDGTVQPSCRRFPPRLLPVLRRPPLRRFFEDGPTVRRHLMADFPLDRTRAVLYVLGACQLFRTDLARVAGPFESRVFLGWDDADWCIRIRDAGGEVVFVADATVIHSYRRLTSRRPVSGAAWRQLRAHVLFQSQYRHRRRELVELSERLDREAAAS